MVGDTGPNHNNSCQISQSDNQTMSINRYKIRQSSELSQLETQDQSTSCYSLILIKFNRNLKAKIHPMRKHSKRNMTKGIYKKMYKYLWVWMFHSFFLFCSCSPPWRSQMTEKQGQKRGRVGKILSGKTQASINLSQLQTKGTQIDDKPHLNITGASPLSRIFSSYSCFKGKTVVRNACRTSSSKALEPWIMQNTSRLELMMDNMDEHLRQIQQRKYSNFFFLASEWAVFFFF